MFSLKEKYPGFGAKKLCALMEGRLSVRTANRLLASQGLACSPPAPKEAFTRFERESPNELWQADFKGLPRRCRYQALSVVDDASRFLVSLWAIPDQTLNSTWAALWETFGEYGLPDTLLTDNGPTFRNNGTWRPSQFDVRLMLLGVRPAHIKAYRPQSQGKVERFHGTLQRDLGVSLAKASLEEAATMFREYRAFFNQVRPHEAIGQRTPAKVYTVSGNKRPDRLPEHRIPEGCQARKVDAAGKISFRSVEYKLGLGMAGQWVALKPCEEDGVHAVLFAGFALGNLQDYAK